MNANTIERLFSEWQSSFAGLQNKPSQDALNAGLALHKLKLIVIRTEKSQELQKERAPIGVLLRCPAVGAKKTGDANKRP
jgi:thiamine biosynthesis lipoprotein ApbE